MSWTYKYKGDKLKLHYTWICSLWKVSSSFNWFKSPLQAARWIPTSGQSSSSWSIMYWSRPTAMKWSEAISSSENKELNLMASHLNVWMVAKVSMILRLSLVTWFKVHIHSYLLSSQGTICSPHRTSISSSSLLSASLSALTLFCQKQIAPPHQRRHHWKKGCYREIEEWWREHHLSRLPFSAAFRPRSSISRRDSSNRCCSDIFSFWKSTGEF